MKSQRKKNAKLQGEITELTTRLSHTDEELKERISKENPSDTSNQNSIKDKKLIISLQAELKSTKSDIDIYKIKCKELQTSLDNINEEQIKILTQYTEKISTLSQKNEELMEKDRERELILEEYKEKSKETIKRKSSSSASGAMDRLKEELRKAWTDCENYKVKFKQLEYDQEMLNENNRKNKEELASRIITLEEMAKEKENELKEKDNNITTLKIEMTESRAMVISLQEVNG